MKKADIVINFIENFWGSISEKDKKMETTLSDLGFFGDDKKEFLNKFFMTFNIDTSEFDYNKYIEEEKNFSILTPLLFKFFGGKPPENNILEIKIADLVNALSRHKW